MSVKKSKNNHLREQMHSGPQLKEIDLNVENLFSGKESYESSKKAIINEKSKLNGNLFDEGLCVCKSLSRQKAKNLRSKSASSKENTNTKIRQKCFEKENEVSNIVCSCNERIYQPSYTFKAGENNIRNMYTYKNSQIEDFKKVTEENKPCSNRVLRKELMKDRKLKANIKIHLKRAAINQENVIGNSATKSSPQEQLDKEKIEKEPSSKPRINDDQGVPTKIFYPIEREFHKNDDIKGTRALSREEGCEKTQCILNDKKLNYIVKVHVERLCSQKYLLQQELHSNKDETVSDTSKAEEHLKKIRPVRTLKPRTCSSHYRNVESKTFVNMKQKKEKINRGGNFVSEKLTKDQENVSNALLVNNKINIDSTQKNNESRSPQSEKLLLLDKESNVKDVNIASSTKTPATKKDSSENREDCNNQAMRKPIYKQIQDENFDSALTNLYDFVASPTDVQPKKKRLKKNNNLTKSQLTFHVFDKPKFRMKRPRKISPFTKNKRKLQVHMKVDPNKANIGNLVDIVSIENKKKDTQKRKLDTEKQALIWNKVGNKQNSSNILKNNQNIDSIKERPVTFVNVQLSEKGEKSFTSVISDKKQNSSQNKDKRNDVEMTPEHQIEIDDNDAFDNHTDGSDDDIVDTSFVCNQVKNHQRSITEEIKTYFGFEDDDNTETSPPETVTLCKKPAPRRKKKRNKGLHNSNTPTSTLDKRELEKDLNNAVINRKRNHVRLSPNTTSSVPDKTELNSNLNDSIKNTNDLFDALKRDDPIKKINILSDIRILPSTSTSAVLMPEQLQNTLAKSNDLQQTQLNLQDGTAQGKGMRTFNSEPIQTFQSNDRSLIRSYVRPTSWRVDDHYMRHNPHFLRLKQNSLPSFDQEMVLDHTFDKSICENTSISMLNEEERNKENSKAKEVQKSVLDFVEVSGVHKNIQPKENRLSLFDINELSPLKEIHQNTMDKVISARRDILKKRSPKSPKRNAMSNKENENITPKLRTHRHYESTPFQSNNPSHMVVPDTPSTNQNVSEDDLGIKNYFGFDSIESSDTENGEKKYVKYKSNKKKGTKLNRDNQNPARISFRELGRILRDTKKSKVEDKSNVKTSPVKDENNIENDDLINGFQTKDNSGKDELVVGLFEEPDALAVKRTEKKYEMKRPKRHRPRLYSKDSDSDHSEVTTHLKKRKRDVMTEAEKKEFAKWAAAFNSECERIESFDLEIE